MAKLDKLIPCSNQLSNVVSDDGSGTSIIELPVLHIIAQLPATTESSVFSVLLSTKSAYTHIKLGYKYSAAEIRKKVMLQDRAPIILAVRQAGPLHRATSACGVFF